MFKLIPASATGFYQEQHNRLIEDPEAINLTDTPTSDLPNVPQTGLNLDGVLTGSGQSVKFDGSDDYIVLPTTGGLATEMLLEDMGQGVEAVKHGATTNNIAFDTWLKIDSTLTAADNSSTIFENTIQRNSASSTTGYDGTYVVRTIFSTSGTDSVPSAPAASAYFLEFIFASNTQHGSLDWDRFQYCVSGANALPLDTWTHVWCEHSVTGANYPHISPSGAHTFKIYINGELNRYKTGENCMREAAGGGNLDPFPTTSNSLSYFGDRSNSFDGRLDEMRVWINSGTTDSIQGIAAVGNIGLSPDEFSSQTEAAEVLTQFTPTADSIAAWWRFEDLSAADLFASVADSVTDVGQHAQSGTPKNFQGTVDFSEETVLVQGISISSNLNVLEGGTVDHGGLVAQHDVQNELLLEESIRNMVSSATNTWSASGGASVGMDENNIFYGSSAFIVNTGAAGQGATQALASNLYFDKNDYTLSLRLFASTGSTSARITFTLGSRGNSASTTAVMHGQYWLPFQVRNTISAELSETSITGEVAIQQLHNGGTDAGSLFSVDGLCIQEGDYSSVFVGPDQLRKGGQLNWVIGD